MISYLISYDDYFVFHSKFNNIGDSFFAENGSGRIAWIDNSNSLNIFALSFSLVIALLQTSCIKLPSVFLIEIIRSLGATIQSDGC